MGGGSSPKPDKNIGIAALKSAETGEKLLGWMQEQADTTNAWAAEDRNRYTSVFQPLQDQYIAEAKDWASPDRLNQRAGEAVADVRLQSRIADASRLRTAMAQGVNPASGAYQAASAKAGVDSALASVGAANTARTQVRNEAESKMANAINLGSGLAVNPATSMGLSNGAMTSGASGAMSGYGQQGSLLNTDYQNRMQSYNASQAGIAGLAQGLGTLGGMLYMGSSKEIKTDKAAIPEGAALDAVRSMPVESWRYKGADGMGSGAKMIGTYAEDFQRATGSGNGRAIPIQTAIGVSMGAIKDLDRKVDRLLKKEAA